jgi:ankyrin repeat protein
VEELFAAGISVATADRYGNQCLHIAAQNGNKRMVKVCLRWGADVNAQNVCHHTLIHHMWLLSPMSNLYLFIHLLPL